MATSDHENQSNETQIDENQVGEQQMRSQLPLLIGAGIITGGLVAAAIVLFFKPNPQTATVPPSDNIASSASQAGLEQLAKANAEAISSGNLGAAIKIAQEIPTDSDAYAEAQTLIKEWQAEWRQQNALYQQAQTALEAKRWREAKDAARALPENAYWDPLVRPIYTKAEQTISAQAAPVAKPTPAAQPKPTTVASSTPAPTSTPASTPTSSPTSSPTPTQSSSPATASPLKKTFKDDKVEVLLEPSNTDTNTYFLSVSWLTKEPQALHNAYEEHVDGVVTNEGNRQIYTWQDGEVSYNITWDKNKPQEIRYQRFVGQELVADSLLRDGR